MHIRALLSRCAGSTRLHRIDRARRGRGCHGGLLEEDPDEPGAPPLTFLTPTANFQIAFRPGQHPLVARPTGAAPGTLPKVTWSRQIEIDPRVRGFKLEFNEADFR